MLLVNVLVAVRRESANRFHKNLSTKKDFKVQLVSDKGDALSVLADRDQHVDVFVIDNGLGGVYDLIADVRHNYPRLIIVLIDEEADFGLPGQADELSTQPFENDDLVQRITRLMSDRSLETLRADSLPAVRQLAKRLRTAAGVGGKQQAAVAACKDLNFDFVAFYAPDSTNPAKLVLKAQDGPRPIQAVAPKDLSGDTDDLASWSLQHVQSRIAGPTDNPNYPLVAKGRLGAVACIPVVFSGAKYGVIVVCRDQPGTITNENILMLELIGAQLAAAISKERVG
ncbi:MAG: GAF domain-containing protein [Burkholderiales bacterium]|nr:GAF domain-containing protein [Anaerolineae bacterium]